MVLRGVVRTKRGGGRKIAGRFLETVPRTDPAEVTVDGATASQEGVIEGFDPQHRRQGPSASGGIDEERGLHALLCAKLAFARVGEAHAPSPRSTGDLDDFAAFPHDRPRPRGGSAEKGVDIGTEPMGVAAGIGGTGGDEERGGVIGRVAKSLPRPMVEIRKPPFLPASELRIRRLPRSPPG